MNNGMRVPTTHERGVVTQTILNLAAVNRLEQRAEIYPITLSKPSRGDGDPAARLQAQLGIPAPAHPIYPRPGAAAWAEALKELSRGKPLSDYVAEGRR